MLKSARSSIKNQTNEVLGIWDRIRKRDFSGNTGLAIKNSIYQTATTIASKVGSLLFTIIIARMLLPELFGLYSLALSTIVLIAGFTDLGIGTTLVRYVAKKATLAKAGPYVFYLRKIKMVASLILSLVLVLTAKFIADNYYQKPIFYALIAGGIYIMATSFLNFITGVFQAENNFKYPLYKEIFFQVLRLIVVPLTIILTLNKSSEILVTSLILSLSFCYFISIFFLYVNLRKYDKKELPPAEKMNVIKFTLPLTFTILSGIFFGYIDVIILGRFVASEFIAYYQTALALLGSGMAVISFSGALFPIFSKLSGEKLDLGLKKSLKMSILASFVGVILTVLLAPLVIKIVYGAAYLPAANLLRLISLIILIDPLIAIYSSYYISQGRNVFVAKTVIFATVLNIILNYILITSLLGKGMIYAVMGAAIATIVSRGVYLAVLFYGKK
jgi:O-antigen/teichoic acid export membrane protein